MNLQWVWEICLCKVSSWDLTNWISLRYERRDRLVIGSVEGIWLISLKEYSRGLVCLFWGSVQGTLLIDWKECSTDLTEFLKEVVFKGSWLIFYRECSEDFYIVKLFEGSVQVTWIIAWRECSRNLNYCFEGVFKESSLIYWRGVQGTCLIGLR